MRQFIFISFVSTMIITTAITFCLFLPSLHNFVSFLASPPTYSFIHSSYSIFASRSLNFAILFRTCLVQILYLKTFQLFIFKDDCGNGRTFEQKQSEVHLHRKLSFEFEWFIFQLNSFPHFSPLLMIS